MEFRYWNFEFPVLCTGITLLIAEIGFLIFRRDAKKLENYDAGLLVFISATPKQTLSIVFRATCFLFWKFDSQKTIVQTLLRRNKKPLRERLRARQKIGLQPLLFGVIILLFIRSYYDNRSRNGVNRHRLHDREILCLVFLWFYCVVA